MARKSEMGSGSNQQNAQRLVARNIRRQRLGADGWEDGTIRRIVTGRKQTLLAVAEAIPLSVVVIFIGWEYGILAWTDGMMRGIFLATAAQPSSGAVALASEMILALCAVMGASRRVYPRKE